MFSVLFLANCAVTLWYSYLIHISLIGKIMWNCIRYLIEANIYCVHIIPSAMKSYLTEQVKDSSCFLLVHVDFTFHFVFCKFAQKTYFMHLIEAKGFFFFFLLSEPMSTRRVYSWSFFLRPFSLF